MKHLWCTHLLLSHKVLISEHCCSLFTRNFGKLIMKYNFSLHQYADDTQIYGHCKYGKSLGMQIALSECIDDAGWMEANHLKLNISKSEVICFSNSRNVLRIPLRSVSIVADSIIPS